MAKHFPPAAGGMHNGQIIHPRAPSALQTRAVPGPQAMQGLAKRVVTVPPVFKSVALQQVQRKAVTTNFPAQQVAVKVPPVFNPGLQQNIQRKPSPQRPPGAVLTRTQLAPKAPARGLPATAPLIQRKVKVAGVSYSMQTDNLNALVDTLMKYAVTENRQLVDQIITRYDFQNVKFATMSKLVNVMNRTLASESGAKRTEVPKCLHHFWAGGAMSFAGYRNLVAWGHKAREAGWLQYIMTDSVVNRHFNNEDLRHQLDSLTTCGATIVDMAQLPVGRSAPYLKLRDDVLGTNKMTKLPYMSDLARYAQMLAIGGVYVDVDVSPGTVDLSKRVSILGEVPLLGPGFRTVGQAREMGALSDNQADREQATLRMFSADVNGVGNHFIMAPRNNPYVHKANEIAAENVMNADVTNGGIDFLKAFKAVGGNVSTGVAASIPHRWLNKVTWVTPESDSTVD